MENPINILVQRRASIGDVIMTTGVVRELKKKYGRFANIDIATDCQEAYRNNPHIRNIFPVDIIGQSITQYELYINLDEAYELNPANHYVDSYFYRAFGNGHNMDKSVELFPDADDKKVVDQFFANKIQEKFIVVHLRNWAWAAKNISMDIWFDIFGKLFNERTDFKIVCVGGPNDHFVEHPLFVDARGKFNNQQLKHLCDSAQCFAGIDSGPFHCASASKTHIIALLTHLKPERILPYRKWEFGYNTSEFPTLEDCAGCNDDQVRPVRQVICKKGNTPCTNNFNTDAIAATILKYIGK